MILHKNLIKDLVIQLCCYLKHNTLQFNYITQNHISSKPSENIDRTSIWQGFSQTDNNPPLEKNAQQISLLASIFVISAFVLIYRLRSLIGNLWYIID